MRIAPFLIILGNLLFWISLVRGHKKWQRRNNRNASYRGSLEELEKQIKEHWDNSDLVGSKRHRGIALAYAYVDHDGTISRVEALHYKKHPLSAKLANVLLKTKNWLPAVHKGSRYVEPVLVALAVNLSKGDLMKMAEDINAEPSKNSLYNGLKIIPDFLNTGLFNDIIKEVNSYNNGCVSFSLHRMYNRKPLQINSLEDWTQNKEESNTRPASEMDSTVTYPMFPGGEEECYKYIYDNMKYPEITETNGIPGVVYTEFTINEDGSLSDIIILKGPGYGMDEETLRLIKAMPNWIPATHNGKPVPSLTILPIRFMPK